MDDRREGSRVLREQREVALDVVREQPYDCPPRDGSTAWARHIERRKARCTVVAKPLRTSRRERHVLLAVERDLHGALGSAQKGGGRELDAVEPPLVLLARVGGGESEAPARRRVPARGERQPIDEPHARNAEGQPSLRHLEVTRGPRARTHAAVQGLIVQTRALEPNLEHGHASRKLELEREPKGCARHAKGARGQLPEVDGERAVAVGRHQIPVLLSYEQLKGQVELEWARRERHVRGVEHVRTRRVRKRRGQAQRAVARRAQPLASRRVRASVRVVGRAATGEDGAKAARTVTVAHEHGVAVQEAAELGGGSKVHTQRAEGAGAPCGGRVALHDTRGDREHARHEGFDWARVHERHMMPGAAESTRRRIENDFMQRHVGRVYEERQRSSAARRAAHGC